MYATGFKQVFHLSVLGYYVYFDFITVSELIRNVSTIDGLKDEYLYMIPQFATIWSQFVFQDYYLLSCLEDLLAFTSKNFLPSFKQTLSEHANNLYIYVTLPFIVVICANFWVFYSIHTQLIDEYNIVIHLLDDHSNHVVHTIVIPILLVELFITHRKFPSSLTEAYALWKMTIPFGCYWTVVFGMKLFCPVWPYPYFRLMTSLQWVAYILLNMMLSYIVYVFGYLCNSLIWGKNETSSEDSEEKPAKERQNLAPSWSSFLRLVQVFQGR